MREFWLRRVAPRLETDRGLWLFVAFVCVALYLVSARWTVQIDDAEATAWPAWALAHHGTLNLEGLAGLPANGWFIHLHGHIVSGRMIGAVLMAVPVNVLLGWTGLSPLAAGALTAVLVAAAAVATMAVVLRRIVGTHWALAATAVLGFGTGMWTIASNELWTHGPDALWLSLCLLGVSRRRYLLAGVALMPSMLVRPHLIAVAIVMAAVLAVLERRLAPLVIIPCGIAGLGGLAVANHVIYGGWSLSGGYGAVGYSVSGAASGGASWGGQLSAGLVTLQRLTGAFVSPERGVLLYTPAVLVGLAALAGTWRKAPAWTVAAAAGGTAYELAQCRINTFTGGGGFFSNRLIIEWIVLCLPLMAVCVRAQMARRPQLLPIAAGAAALSIAIHSVGVILTPWLVAGNPSPWRDWYLLTVLRAAGTNGVTMAVVALLATTAAALAARRHAQRPNAVSYGARPESSLHPVGWAPEPAQTV